MFDTAANHSDSVSAPRLDPGLTDQLPADAYCHLVHTLRLTLPPGDNPSPEDFARRDRAAIARVAALCPANAAEADLAAQFVAASEQWKDCLRLAQEPETSSQWAMKCRAQAASMMRQANSALRLLLRMQQGRRKLQSDAAASNSLAWTEHCALGFMAEALSAEPRHPVPLPDEEDGAAKARFPEDEGEAAAPPPPLAGEGGAGEGSTGKAGGIARGERGEGQAKPEPAAKPAPELLAAAEEYAAEYPIRAALIRRIGRMQDAQHRICGKPLRESFFFSPPEDDLMQALIAARTPYLIALDEAYPNAVPRERARADAAAPAVERAQCPRSETRSLAFAWRISDPGH